MKPSLLSTHTQHLLPSNKQKHAMEADPPRAKEDSQPNQGYDGDKRLSHINLIPGCLVDPTYLWPCHLPITSVSIKTKEPFPGKERRLPPLVKTKTMHNVKNPSNTKICRHTNIYTELQDNI